MLNIKDKKLRKICLIIIIFGFIGVIDIFASDFNNHLFVEKQNFSDEYKNDLYGLKNSGPSWWDIEWKYRREILINNTANSNTLTSYLMSLNIPYYNEMKSDFEDIRFIDSNLNELNYWIESTRLGSNAVIWVNVSSIPSLSTTTIHMYYGNPNAASKSKFLIEFTYNSTLDYTVSGDYWTTRNLWEKPGSNNMYVFGTPSGWPSSWYWTGSSWAVDNTATSGLPYHMAYQNRYHYYDEDWGEIMFYTTLENSIYENHIKNWDGSSWVTNSSLETGLNLHNGNSSSGGRYLNYIMFTFKGQKHLLLGIDLHKYTWNGIQWIENASVPVPDGLTSAYVHLHYRFTQNGIVKSHRFPVLLEHYNETHCRIWQLNDTDWDIIHTGKVGDFPNSFTSHIPDSNVIDNRLTLSVRHSTYPLWSSNLYFADIEPTYKFGLIESLYLGNFTITWENDVSAGMRNHKFIDLDDDGRLEMIRDMPNYITSIYALTNNTYEFYANISIAVYEFGDYDGDGINELVGRPALSNDYYFYNFSWEEKTLNFENIWVTGYDDRGLICFGDVDNDGKEELVYADNGIAYGGNEGRRRLISFDGTTFNELQSFDDVSSVGWDGWAYATLIDIDGDGNDEIACGWGNGSGLDGYVRIFDDPSQSYTQLIQYNFENDTTFLSNFDEHEDLNGDGIVDLIVGNSHTGVDIYRYIVFYNASTSSFSYTKLTLQSGHAPYQYGTGKIKPSDVYARYVSFGPQNSTNRYWEDKINLYLWNQSSLSFESPIIIQLNDIYSGVNPRLNLRDINGDGYDEVIWDGYDISGKQVTHFIFFDTTPPTWIESPSNQTIEFGNDFIYDLNASDTSGIDLWLINDTANFQIDVNGVITNTTFLSVGEYWLEVSAHDPSNNNCSATFKITVDVTTAPIWDQLPTDQTLEFGNDFIYDLNASDTFGIDHWLINDTTNFLIDGNGIITNNTFLSVGEYWLEVSAHDPSNNNCSATFKITVEDTTAPTWDQLPTDQLLEFGNDFIYDLNASDISGIDHWLINDTTNFQIDINGVITNNTFLSVGEYWVNVSAHDPYNSNCSAAFKITVGDTTAPTWDQLPVDQLLQFGNDFIYDLNASDISGIDHWLINDTTNFLIDGNGIITNTTFLSFGDYWLEVSAHDPYNNNCSAKFKITVGDFTAPTWDQLPTDQPLELGNDFIYDLNASDTFGIDHWLINDTTNFQIDINGVITNNTFLSVGEYWVNVSAHDPSNNNCSATFKITVEVTIAPTWDQVPINQVVELGNNISYDLNASSIWGIDLWWINDTINFQIYGNGTMYNDLPLSVGIYWLEIRASDPYTNFCSGIINITVEDTTGPSFTPEITIIQLTEYGNNFILNLNASDLSGIDQWWIDDTINFQIYENGVVVNRNPLLLRDYPVVVRVNDTYNNYENVSFIIRVVDTIAPVITIIAPEYNQSFGIYSPAYYITIDDRSIVEYGLQSIWYTLDGGITTFTTSAQVGFINEALWELISEEQVIIEFYVLDTSGNQGYAQIIVNKELPVSPPSVPPPGIPGYNILIIGLISIISIILLKNKLRERKKP